MLGRQVSTMVTACLLALGCTFLPLARAQVSRQSDASGAPWPKLKLRSSSGAAAPDNSHQVPANALRIYRQAIHELHQGQTSAAEKDARRAIRLDERFADAYALEATASLVERNYALARTQAIQAAVADPRDQKAWVIAATADNYLGRYVEASAALGRIPEQDTGAWQIAYQWARAEAGQRNARQALEWSNRAALTAPPTFAPLHLLRASALLAEGQYGLAAGELETYLSLVAPDAPQHTELIQELRRLQKLTRSEQASQSTRACFKNAS